MAQNTVYSLNADKLSQITGDASVPNYPVYSATISIDPNQSATFGIVTTSAIGNATVNFTSGGKFGQTVRLLIANDATLARTITFGTSLKTNSTVVGTTSKTIALTLVSDGTNFYESARSGAAL